MSLQVTHEEIKPSGTWTRTQVKLRAPATPSGDMRAIMTTMSNLVTQIIHSQPLQTTASSATEQNTPSSIDYDQASLTPFSTVDDKIFNLTIEEDPGNQMTMQATSRTTVLAVKKWIENQKGLTAGQVDLLYDDLPLGGEGEIGAYGIKNNAVLVLVRRSDWD